MRDRGARCEGTNEVGELRALVAHGALREVEGVSEGTKALDKRLTMIQ